jgi:hypothetical protein
MTTAPRQPPTTRRPPFAALAALAVGVLAVHIVLLMTSGAEIWRLQPESQKLGPLQTRVVTTGIDTAPVRQEEVTTPKPAPPEAIKHRAPAPPQATEANMQAIASPALPALPEATESLATNAPLTPVVASEEPNTPSSPDRALASTAPGPVDTANSSATPSAPKVNALNAPLGEFPPNVQINYKLTGQERGLNYYASGTLKWQTQAGTAIPRAYEAELQVKAFLVGRRIWRSVGQLTDKGLAPRRYSDSWRGERAAHFEADTQKISFSGNSPSTPLLPGAQDQVSLFIQMAATVAAQSFNIGTELNVQTATARDAVNWTLTYKSDDMIDLNGDRVETQRWVCLPRGKFDSQIEMWFAKSTGGLPVRIKITQVSGNFIDMEMRGSETLPALAD